MDGGLFSVGDGHYRQGEGEACGTAVEGAMDVTLIVELIKGGGPAWPRLETDDHLVVVGSSRPLEDAWRVSQVGMVTWLMELYGMDRMDAYQAAVADQPGPAGQRGGRQLQRGHEGAEGAASRGGRLRRRAPAAA